MKPSRAKRSERRVVSKQTEDHEEILKAFSGEKILCNEFLATYKILLSSSELVRIWKDEYAAGDEDKRRALLEFLVEWIMNTNELIITKKMVLKELVPSLEKSILNADQFRCFLEDQDFLGKHDLELIAAELFLRQKLFMSQMSIHEAIFFCRPDTRGMDCGAAARAPNVWQLLIYSSNITFWVAATLLYSIRYKHRELLIKCFMNLAVECRKRKDFNSFYSLLAGLQSSQDHSKQTWLRFSKKNPELNDNFDALRDKYLDPKTCIRAYKEITEITSEMCIPFMPLLFLEFGIRGSPYSSLKDTLSGARMHDCVNLSGLELASSNTTEAIRRYVENVLSVDTELAKVKATLAKKTGKDNDFSTSFSGVTNQSCKRFPLAYDIILGEFNADVTRASKSTRHKSHSRFRKVQTDLISQTQNKVAVHRERNTHEIKTERKKSPWMTIPGNPNTWEQKLGAGSLHDISYIIGCCDKSISTSKTLRYDVAPQPRVLGNCLAHMRLARIAETEFSIAQKGKKLTASVRLKSSQKKGSGNLFYAGYFSGWFSKMEEDGYCKLSTESPELCSVSWASAVSKSPKQLQPQLKQDIETDARYSARAIPPSLKRKLSITTFIKVTAALQFSIGRKRNVPKFVKPSSLKKRRRGGSQVSSHAMLNTLATRKRTNSTGGITTEAERAKSRIPPHTCAFASTIGTTGSHIDFMQVRGQALSSSFVYNYLLEKQKEFVNSNPNRSIERLNDLVENLTYYLYSFGRVLGKAAAASNQVGGSGAVRANINRLAALLREYDWCNLDVVPYGDTFKLAVSSSTFESSCWKDFLNNMFRKMHKQKNSSRGKSNRHSESLKFGIQIAAPVCMMTTGFISGWLSGAAKEENIGCVEVNCTACGDLTCQFLIGPTTQLRSTLVDFQDKNPNHHYVFNQSCLIALTSVHSDISTPRAEEGSASHNVASLISDQKPERRRSSIKSVFTGIKRKTTPGRKKGCLSGIGSDIVQQVQFQYESPHFKMETSTAQQILNAVQIKKVDNCGKPVGEKMQCPESDAPGRLKVQVSDTIYLYGKSVSTYPRILESDGLRQGDPICDVIVTQSYESGYIICVCDGCGWGYGSRNAARIAATHYLDALAGKIASFKDTGEIAKALLDNLGPAHEKIIEEAGDILSAGTTTAYISVLLPILGSKDEWALTSISLGDCKCFLFSTEEHQVTDISCSNSSARHSASDCGGRLGPILHGGHPDLRNLGMSCQTLKEGDLFYVVSDGVFDNMDPRHLGIPPGDVGVEAEDWKMAQTVDDDQLRATVDKWTTNIMKDLILGTYSPRKKRKSKEQKRKHPSRGSSARIVRANPKDSCGISPKSVTTALISYCVNITTGSRTWMEENTGKLPDQYEKYPGKLDHTTCLAVSVKPITI